VPDGEHVDTLGTAKIRRQGSDLTIAALGLMVPRALEAAERLQAEHGISATVIDVRSLVPLDTRTIFCRSLQDRPLLHGRGRIPRLCGWGLRSRAWWPRNYSGSGCADCAHPDAARAVTRSRPTRGLTIPSAARIVEIISKTVD